ncbi:MAG: ribonuclease HII [Oscillospiraceae bacterium]|nr:ribonuclease HII [Oscillospiraceae bacterium]
MGLCICLELWDIEGKLLADGYETICGVDEAGRGPLAGPVFASAAILPYGIDIPDLNDSKKLSEKVRERLFDEITSKALAYGIASADEREIDELNILNATFLAMNRAIEKLTIKPDIALIDGNRDSGIRCNCTCIVGGDGKSASIAAASILAKVSRDRYMVKMSEIFPQYGFERHKGYGTKLHYEKLREFGPSEIHRATFLKRIIDGC